MNKEILKTPLSLLAGYGTWLQDVMMKHCGNIEYLQIAKCIGYDDVCASFSCVTPEFNMKVCKNDSSQAYSIFSVSSVIILHVNITFCFHYPCLLQRSLCVSRDYIVMEA